MLDTCYGILVLNTGLTGENSKYNMLPASQNSISLFAMSYKNLEIWEIAREIVIKTHVMSLNLPRFEQFEEAQQIRRSSKTVKSCIVEGYGRRRYKADYIKFLIYALSSNDETLDHLETLFETGSLKEAAVYNELHLKIDLLGKKLNSFIQSVELYHNNFPV